MMTGSLNHVIIAQVYMPKGARKMEKFRANQAANEIRDEDHAGDANVEIIGRFIPSFPK